MPYSAIEHAVRPKIGLALGSGVARGWAHIGVVNTLSKAGFHADIVSGTSIGALVGGCSVAGKLPALETFARSLTRRRMLSFLDLRFGGAGLISDAKLEAVLQEHLRDIRIEHLGRTFVSVATELDTGHEVWLHNGDLIDAIRASYAMPGVFQPVHREGRWLIDGALVNPVPVSVCRALGARMVIAINLNADVFGKAMIPETNTIATADFAQQGKLSDRLFKRKPEAEPSLPRQVLGSKKSGPGVTGVMLSAFNIVQDRLARARLAGDPPDVTITPPVGHINPIDFDKADDLIRIGAQATEEALPHIEEAMKVLS